MGGDFHTEPFKPKDIILAFHSVTYMSGSSYPNWIRLLDNVTGVITITVALTAVLELSFSFIYALELLSIGLFLTGVAWVVWGAYIIHSNTYARVFMILTGVSVIALSLVDFVFYSLPPEFLILFPALAVLQVGLSRLVLAFLIKDIELWIKMLQGLVGILTLILAAFVFVSANAGFVLMLIFLVISLLANGLVRLIVVRTEFPQKCSQCSEDSAS
jgi:hypothetical protein